MNVKINHVTPIQVAKTPWDRLNVLVRMDFRVIDSIVWISTNVILAITVTQMQFVLKPEEVLRVPARKATLVMA